MNLIYQESIKKRRVIPAYARHEIFKRDNFRCLECGVTNKEKELHIDHIIPVSQGGSDGLNNLQTLCVTCNLLKHNRAWVAGCIELEIIEFAFRCFMDKFSQNYPNNNSSPRYITECPQGHEVVTSKKKGIQCKACMRMGNNKRFDR